MKHKRRNHEQNRFCDQYLQDKKCFLSDEASYGAIAETELKLQLGRITPGMNREALKSHNGKGLFSYRVNEDVRIICYEWRAGEILLLLVDHHDKAYARASRMELGTANLSPTELPKVVIHELKIIDYVQTKSTCKLSEIPLEKLTRLVGSKETAAQLQLAHDEDDLLKQLETLVTNPQLRDDLIDLSSKPTKIDAVLARPPTETKRVPVEQAAKKTENWCLLDDATIQGFMNGTLENWQVFLHPSQRSAVEMKASGPMMVTGSAGTGKTVVAVHRVKWLLSNVFTKGEKILFTTFTRTLARNARTWLDAICPPDMRQRVDVRNLDEFVRKLMDVHLKGKHVDYSETPSSFEIKPPLGGKWDEKFIYREFQDIILEYRIGSLEEYKSFQRPARFGRLAASEREMLWPVFDEMKKAISSPTCSRIPKAHALNQLAAYFKTELGQECREYASIVVDESQDFGASEYRFFAAYTNNTFENPVPNSLFLAGDGYQRIYGRSGTFRASNINVVNRSTRLKKCYRSTKKIREFSERLIADVDAKNMDGEVSSIHDGESLLEGVPVEERYFPGNFPAMYEAIANAISKWKENGSKNLGDYAVLLPRGRTFTKNGRPMDVLSRTAIELSNRGIPTKPFNGNAEDRPFDTVNVMTMHSAKGLQFHGVVVCLNNWPMGIDRDADPAQKKAILDESRCLLYVAIMRASYRVLLTATKSRPRELPSPER